MSLPEEQKLIKTTSRLQQQTRTTTRPIYSHNINTIREVTTPSQSTGTTDLGRKEMIGATKGINVEHNDDTQDLHNVTTEYRFIHQNMARQFGLERVLLPFMLFLFEITFIILFAVFASYKSDDTLTTQMNTVPTYSSMF
jgi:hypothetical protein